MKVLRLPAERKESMSVLILCSLNKETGEDVDDPDLDWLGF